MLLRIASAVVLVPAVLALVVYATPTYFLIALGILGTLCLYEYFGLIRSMGLHGQPWFGYAAFWALSISRFSSTLRSRCVSNSATNWGCTGLWSSS
jgi:CDP-diglyceride synthetase